MKSTQYYAICLVLLASLGAQAKPPADAAEREKQAQRLKPETNISVIAYDKKSGMIAVRIDDEPAVGPNITTIEWLLEGVDNESNASEYKRHPDRLIGTHFRTKKTLWLLNDKEIAERRAKAAKKNAKKKK